MYHKIEIIGNVGKQPEMRYTPSGQAVTSFSVAANNQYKNKAGEMVKETVWFRVSTWGKQAEVCNQYVSQGMLVLVVGKMNADKSTGGPHVFQKQDGTSSASYEVTAETVKFLSHGKEQTANADAAPAEESNFL